MNIFISYRRDDSIVSAKLVRNELVQRFGADHVFMDIDDIGYGDDFVQAIDRHVQAADVVLVVIGPRWAELLQARLRGDDWVRHEVASALKLRSGDALHPPGQLRVLPLLVGGAKPPAEALPPELAGLQRLSMLNFDERALNASVNTLLEAILRRRFEEQAKDVREELRGRRRAQVAGLLIGAMMFLAGWMALFDFFGLDTRQASATMQLAALVPGAGAPAWSGQVVLVGIDESSERALKRKFDTSWRTEHARVIENAASAGARTLAFDLFLEDAGDPAADAALEQALAATRTTMPVVFGVQQMDGAQPLMPPRLMAQSHWGIACAGEKLALARSMLLAVQRPASAASAGASASSEPVRVHPSLALAAFSGGARPEPIDEASRTVRALLPREQRSRAITYYAAETVARSQPACTAVQRGDRVVTQLFDVATLPALDAPPQRLRYEQVLNGELAALALLNGKIVLVGPQFKGQDVLPVGGGKERWGVELIAAQIDAMSRGAAIKPLGGVAQWLSISALGLLGAVVAYRLRRRRAALRAAVMLGIALSFVVLAVAWYASEQQLIGLPYGLGALALGTWAAHRLSERKTP